jgi:hypothetical protein
MYLNYPNGFVYNDLYGVRSTKMNIISAVRTPQKVWLLQQEAA